MQTVLTKGANNQVMEKLKHHFGMQDSTSVTREFYNPPRH